MPKVKSPSPLLAVPLAEIATTGEKVERAAVTLLTAIRQGDLRSLGAFDDAVNAAYEANRWHTRPGRPAKDRRSVPHTVRTYVWEIRSAYRAGLEVWKFKTMYELRMARKAEKESAVETTATESEEQAQVTIPASVAQDLEGVRVLAIRQPNGALFHDLISLFIQLPDDQRALLGRQLARLLHRYQAAQSVPAPVPQRGRKAA